MLRSLSFLGLVAAGFLLTSVALISGGEGGPEPLSEKGLGGIRFGPDSPVVRSANLALDSIGVLAAFDAHTNAATALPLQGIQVIFLTGNLGCSPPAVPQLRELASIRSRSHPEIGFVALHYSEASASVAQRESLLLKKVTRAAFPHYYSETTGLLVRHVGVPSVLVLADGHIHSMFALYRLPSVSAPLDAGLLDEALLADIQALQEGYVIRTR